MTIRDLARWRNWPWAAKLTMLLVALAIAPLAVVTLYNYASTRQELLAASRSESLQQARGTAEEIDAYLGNVLADLHVIATAPATIHFARQSAPGQGAEKGGAGGDSGPADVGILLRQVRDSHGFDAIYLADLNGEVILATAGRLLHRRYGTAPFFASAAAGRTSFDEPREDPEDGRIFLHLSAPIPGEDGRIVGVAVGRVTLAEIDRIIDADSRFGGRGEYGILWDAEGIRLSHPTKPGWRFRPFSPLLPAELTRLLAEARFGPATAELLTVRRPILGLVERSRRLLSAANGLPADPNLRVRAAGAEPVDAVIVTLRNQRWLYGIFTPEAETLSALRRETRRGLAIAIATALLAIGLALTAARWVTRPLRLVVQAADAIATGDASRRVGLDQGDELGGLSTAFDAMADAIAAKDAEVRAHAEQLELRVEERTAALRASEAELRSLFAAAEEANRMKDEFLSTVSHELRTPLSAILGWTWMLAGGRLDAEASRRAVATIERNARAQSQIIDDLLDVSRIIAGKLLLEVHPLELAPIVEASLEAARPAAAAKEIRCEAHLEPGAMVTADANRLQQVVWNLLSNAVKFTPRQGRVEVRTETVEGQVELRVSDTGVGIRRDFLDHVFDRFRQADSSTTRTYGGLGLGLAIVRHLVELHGGTVAAESPGPGLGATFTVRLPTPHTADLPAADGEPAAPGEDLSLAGLTVLLVDDEPDARELLPAVLERYGAKVRVAGSAEEALSLLARFGADVLLADIGMPEEDGYSLLSRVRQLDGRVAAVPVIALTAYAGGGHRRRALDAGFQAHLAKPVAPRDLALAVARAAKTMTPVNQ